MKRDLASSQRLHHVRSLLPPIGGSKGRLERGYLGRRESVEFAAAGGVDGWGDEGEDCGDGGAGEGGGRRR